MSYRHGSNLSFLILHTQKIQGSSVDPGLRLFGSAISGTVDMDGNDYPGRLD